MRQGKGSVWGRRGRAVPQQSRRIALFSLVVIGRLFARHIAVGAWGSLCDLPDQSAFAWGTHDDIPPTPGAVCTLESVAWEQLLVGLTGGRKRGRKEGRGKGGEGVVVN